MGLYLLFRVWKLTETIYSVTIFGLMKSVSFQNSIFSKPCGDPKRVLLEELYKMF